MLRTLASTSGATIDGSNISKVGSPPIHLGVVNVWHLLEIRIPCNEPVTMHSHILAAVLLAAGLGFVTAALTTTPQVCNHDNCLRQFLQSPAIAGFCATYTQAVHTASMGLPTYVS